MADSIVFTPSAFELRIIGNESDRTSNVTGAGVLTTPSGVLLVSAVTDTQEIVLDTPAFVLSITDTPPVSLPAPAFILSITDTPPVSLHAPTFELTASGTTGEVGNVALSTPATSLVITSPNGVVLAAPVSILVASGTTGVSGAVSLLAPTAALALTASIPFVATAALEAPLGRVVIAGISGTNSALRLSLTKAALAITGATGTVGTVDLELPVIEMLVGGGQAVTGTVVLAIPILRLQVTGQRAANANAGISTLVMHTEQMSLSTYTNYPFNSFAVFQGVALGASSDGIFALSGATDAGTAIAAVARLGISDFGTSHLKRIDRLYVGYRTDGDMVLRVLTDEVTSRDYSLKATGKSGLHGNHVRVGKGVEARYWQFEIQNTNGADFELNSIEAKPTVLRRRVGGSSG